MLVGICIFNKEKFPTMLAIKPRFYIILLTIHIVFSYEDANAFLTKVVDKIYKYSSQNSMHNHQSRIKTQNTVRRYNLSNIKDGGKLISYRRFNKPYYLIRHNKVLEPFPVNFRKFFDKACSFVYNEMNQNSKSNNRRNKSKIFFMDCNYPKTRFRHKLYNKHLNAHFCKITPLNMINNAIINKLIMHRNVQWKRNVITRNGFNCELNLLCFTVPNDLSSTKTRNSLFHLAPYEYSFTCCLLNNHNSQRNHRCPFVGEQIFHAVCSKNTFHRPDIYKRKTLDKNRNKIAEINLIHLNTNFSESMRWSKNFINPLPFGKTFERRDNKTLFVRNFLGRSENPNADKFYARKYLQNVKIKFPSIFFQSYMLYNHLPFFHKMNKRSVEISFENNTRSYSSLENVSTDDAENAFPNSLGSINPLERRGEDGVIYIHGLFEMSDGECREYPQTGRFEYEAAQLAIQHVNERNIIDGYQLEMYYNDTKCDSGVAVDAFFHSLYRQPTMSVILGTGSSEVTERLARVVSRWNVMQMSYGATSPALSDRENFPLFFRTIAPDSSHNAALLAFVLHHKWLTVAALHEQGDKHALPMTKLITDLEQVNVTVKVTKGTSERDYKDHLQELKDQDCRIVICSFSSSLFRKIFCQVYHLGMHGAEYAWIILGDTTDSWKGDASGTECNDHQLITAIQGVISVGSHYEAVGNGTAISEMTITEILDTIQYKQNYRSTGFISQTYDAVWAIALTFQNVEQNWRSINSSSTLGQFTYDNHLMAQDFSTTMANLRFMGVSGPVSFYNSDRVGITAFHQKQDKIMKLAAIYNPDEARLDFQCASCSGLVWQGGSPPISSRIIIRRIATLDRRVFICVTALAALGVTLALTFLSFNLYYRKLKFIKLSSPNLNNFVVVGCVLVYIAVILLGVDHGTLVSDDHFPVICSARAFLLSGGFSLAFGCMFIKTYRVYHIFIRTNTGIVKSKLLHDQQLLGMVSVLLLVDCVLVTLWVTVDPMERQLTHLSLQVNREERNVGYLYLREHCNSAHMAKWLGSLYIYKGLLLVVGCYMAWETRHVKVPALNDSQYIGMSVYNVVITSIIVVALANVIPADRYTLTFVLVSTLIFVSTTTTLCILFVPKIHTILINPEDAAVVATPGVKVECKTRRFALDEPRESLYRAEVQNRALKRELIELDQEYNRLAEKIGFTPCTLRKPRLSDNQDEDSDDGLPPWLADYKDYSSAPNEDVWCTSRPTIASAFNTIHSVALHLPSTSTSFLKEAVKDKSDYTLNSIYYTPLRASLTKIDNREDISLECCKPVRSFLSDRALNKLKIPQTLRETIFDDVEDSPIPFRNLLPSVLEKHLRSEPKLFSEIHSQSNLHFTSFPSRSLNQVSNLRDSLSDFSKNTSGASEFTTAQLYDSTSFSTPPEDFASSSNNGHDSTKSAQRSSENTTSNYLTCDEDSAQQPREISQSQKDVETKCNVNSVLSSPENSTFHEFSSNKSDTNALSGSSSSTSAATVSDLSTDISDISKHGTSNAAVSVDESPTRCSSSLRTVKNDTQEQSQSCPQSEIRNININIGETRCTVTEVQPSNFMERTAETAANEIGAKCNMIKIDADNSSEKSDSANSNENKTTPSQHNNNATEEPERAVQIDNLRNQIFRLERELILLQLDQSDAVDL